ncbi:MAG: PDZ domain-containing protein [Gaiellales bacterium]
MSVWRVMSWRRGLLALIILGAIAFAILRFTPSDTYLFVPNSARPVAPLVHVPDDQESTGKGGIFMVDISVKRASLFERLFPGLSEESTLVPGDVLNPEGVSDEQRRRRSALQMTTSQEVSAAVALRALGYDVATNESGAVVDLVQPDGAASGVLQPGDVIIEANGHEVKTLADLQDAMADVTPGRTVAVSYQRSGGVESAEFETQASADDPGRALIGVRVEQAADIQLPIPVEIDTGNVGGPSAGLAFALDVVDELGTDLDRGRTVVATGELGIDGTVTAVGGVKQKTFSARDVDADIFIVPKDRNNDETALEHAGDVEIIAVETFGEAVEALTGEPVSAIAGDRLESPASQAAGR